uniref:Uncharacterized protein n=1 Tax=Schizaphis graminum TaxID=13262 RepID=A0A2S2NAX8_SCHGA
MQGRGYEKEDERNGIISHQRTFSGTPSCNEFAGVARSTMDVSHALSSWRPAERHPSFKIARPGPAASGTGVDNDAVATTPIAVTEQYGRLLMMVTKRRKQRYSKSETIHCAYV